MKINYNHLLKEGCVKNFASAKIRLLCKRSFLQNKTCRNVLDDKNCLQDFPFLVVFKYQRSQRHGSKSKEFPWNAMLQKQNAAAKAPAVRWGICTSFLYWNYLTSNIVANSHFCTKAWVLWGWSCKWRKVTPAGEVRFITSLGLWCNQWCYKALFSKHHSKSCFPCNVLTSKRR